MRYCFKSFLIFFGLFIQFMHPNSPIKKISVKVLLKEFKPDSNSTLHLSSTHGIMVDTLDSSKSKRSYYFKHSVPITIKENSICLNQQKIETSKPLRINAFDGHIKYNHDDYCGTFFLIEHNGSYLLVNKVELEDYIYSVLRAESWPGWPLEVNKVFAITCRSYVIKKVLESRKNKQPYHIKNTNIHQTYRGIRHNHIHEQAVNETKGLFLGYNNQPIAAMFDSSCGGVTTADIDGKAAGVNFKQAPYLARKKICTFCKRCKIYNWGFEISLKELEKRCINLIPKDSSLTNITIGKKDKAGLVIQLVLHCGKEKVYIDGKKLYSLCKEVKSSKFSITNKKHSVLIKGQGYGHHLGLCQWGAWQMVKDGWHYKRILHFYYPDTNLMQLQQISETEKESKECHHTKDTSSVDS